MGWGAETVDKSRKEDGGIEEKVGTSKQKYGEILSAIQANTEYFQHKG